MPGPAAGTSGQEQPQDLRLGPGAGTWGWDLRLGPQAGTSGWDLGLESQARTWWLKPGAWLQGEDPCEGHGAHAEPSAGTN